MHSNDYRYSLMNLSHYLDDIATGFNKARDKIQDIFDTPAETALSN
jgi:hypothetical protein